MTRREMLRRCLVGGSAAMIAFPGTAAAYARPREPRSGALAIFNTHTGEQLAERYLSRSGRLLPGAAGRLDRLFRCHHNGQVVTIDADLYLLLDDLQTLLGVSGSTFELISGYRSPEYNELLRSRGRGVARHSYHLRGMAADVRLDGVPIRELASAARALRRGGVGRYPGFVHVDVGPVRTWGV